MVDLALARKTPWKRPAAARPAGARLRQRVSASSYPSQPPGGGAWLQTSGGAFPIAIAVLTVAAVTEIAARAAATDTTAQFALVLCAVAAATTLPLTLRPRAAALAVASTSLMSVFAFETLTVAGALVALLALWRLGDAGGPAMATGLAAPFLLVPIAGVHHADSYTGALAMLVGALGATAAWAGSTRRARSEAAEHREARRSIADDLAEHTARGERARIARELHDVVAHHVSMVAVQAETARLTTPDLPEAGAERLLAIGDTARTALSEMRRLLGVLRVDVGGAVDADRRPQPCLADLDELTDLAREASGTSVRLILHGAPVAVDPMVEAAGYRIVQEALTNARRHATGAAIDVELRYGADELVLRIRDNGPGPTVAGASGGHGLTGMRERALATGGDVRAGAARGGGFMVEARLPTGDRAQA